MAEIKTVRTSGVVPHVPVIEPLEATHNGLYVAPSGVDGYSPVTVDVQEQPWEPLEDGYSNFWFELTNDTLSPWLNFSAMNNDAVIDWGDGSGEVALDTLTPTHTYSKAGKYVVKVKGVTGIARQITEPFNGAYFTVLKYVELSDEVSVTVNYCFSWCMGIKNYRLPAIANYGTAAFERNVNVEEFNLPYGVTTAPTSGFATCYTLKKVTLPITVTSIGSTAFYQCIALLSIIIPSSVTQIGTSAFSTCRCLQEIHVQATTPPTLGDTTFTALPSNYIIYVPVGYGETYKAAWSAYADHILEEGQTPNI